MGLAEKIEAIEAIRAVRLAAHELANVCSAIVGGTEMAISISSANELGRDSHDIEPDDFEDDNTPGPLRS